MFLYNETTLYETSSHSKTHIHSLTNQLRFYQFCIRLFAFSSFSFLIALFLFICLLFSIFSFLDLSFLFIFRFVFILFCFGSARSFIKFAFQFLSTFLHIEKFSFCAVVYKSFHVFPSISVLSPSTVFRMFFFYFFVVVFLGHLLCFICVVYIAPSLPTTRKREVKEDNATRTK